MNGYVFHNESNNHRRNGVVFVYDEIINDIVKAVETEDLIALDSLVGAWEESLTHNLSQTAWQELFLVNPLALSVRLNKMKAMKHLTENIGLRLDNPCPSKCDCRLCQTIHRDLRFHQMYANHFLTALISRSYIQLFHSRRPIGGCLDTWRAIDGSGLFYRYSQLDLGRKLHQMLEQTVIEFLDTPINEEEVQMLLYDEEEENPLDRSFGNATRLIAAGMKNAVSHPAVQSVVMSHWTKDSDALFPDRWTAENLPFPLRVMFSTFVYFVVVPACVIFPHPTLIRFLKSPTTAYTCEAVAYWTFLIFVATTFFYEAKESYILCEASIQPYHYIMALIILSRMTRICVGMYCLGKSFFNSPYEILQFISCLMYTFGNTFIFIARLVVPNKEGTKAMCRRLAKIWSGGQNLSAADALELMLAQQSSTCASTSKLYMIEPHFATFFNDALQPHNVGAIFFSIGHLFYFLSAGNVLYMNRLVSHLNITVTRMVVDVIRWALLMLLFFVAWGLALVSLYSNYRCENQFFSNVRSSFFEMFWVIFAMTGTNDYVMNGTLSKYNHVAMEVIEYFGFALYGTYYIIAQIVLVNLLVALMSVTFQKIHDSRKLELSFWRSKIQIKYIHWNTVLPSPFNLLYPLFHPYSLVVEKCLQRRNDKFKVSHDDFSDRRAQIVDRLWTRNNIFASISSTECCSHA